MLNHLVEDLRPTVSEETENSKSKNICSIYMGLRHANPLIVEKEPRGAPKAREMMKVSLTCLQSIRERLRERGVPRGERAQRGSLTLAGEDAADGTWKEVRGSRGGE